MTTLHKAAQAALEALCLPCDRWNATQHKIVGKAIDDLRAALAQEPAQQVVDSDEKAGAYMEARLWEFIDMAAAWPKASPDPRTWNHVMVYAPQPAVQEPATSFDDPRVQLVYETIIDADDFPPKEDPQQHWDGWIARRIVDKLFAKRLTDEQKRDMVTNYFAEDWAIKAAIGMLDDYEAAVLGEKP